MTYLELVNKVLIRLREDEVTTVGQNGYSKLIGEFVNDALRQVEDAWDWSALRETITVETQLDIFNYVLTGSGDKSKLLNAVNDTQNIVMEYKPQTWFDKKFLTQDVQKGSPRYFTFNSLDDNGDTTIDVYPIPDGTPTGSLYGEGLYGVSEYNNVGSTAYELRFNMVIRTKELVNDSDKIRVPFLPVLMLAQGMAVRERGEAGAQSVPELFFNAEKALSDAISLDATKHPEETIFYMG